MTRKMIPILALLAMLLILTPTASADECAHTNVDQLMKCEDCGSAICPKCGQAGTNYIRMEPSCTVAGRWALKCSTHGLEGGGVDAFGHIDENNDLICDRCGDHTLHRDTAPPDHKCDYGNEIISECTDVNPVDHKCDICGKELTQCLDKSPEDHYCDICNGKITECQDKVAPYNYCDICGKATGCTHPSVDNYRICSDCGKQVCPSCNRVPGTYQLSTKPTCTGKGVIVMACPCSTAPGYMVTWTVPALGHVDANNDHYCDRCSISSCLDKNPADHKCDVCGEKLSECQNENPADHACDICGKKLSECVDETPANHMCDICGKKLSECVDEPPADHKCDICGTTISQCRDTDPLNNVCDICGKELECIHSDIDNYRICRTCGKQICPSCNRVPETYQITTNPTCTKEGVIVMVCQCKPALTNQIYWKIPALGHVDADKDHFCDRSGCGIKVSECTDSEPADHKCDICEKELSQCSDTNPKDHMCDVCGKTLSDHTGGTAVCNKKAVCDYCGESYGELKETNHVGETVWTKTQTQHEQKWNCCGASVVSQENHEWENGVCTECDYECQHTGGTATCTDKAVCEICGEKYGELDAANHAGEKSWGITTIKHGQVWSCCDVPVVPVEKHKWENGVCTKCDYKCQHEGGTATCAEKAVCEICGEKYGEPDAANHAGEKVWTKTETQHEQKWSCCEAVVAVPLEDHEWENGKCAECSYNCAHTFAWQKESGKYWKKCSICEYETVKKDIPAITINGADTVCITQDYKFSITLPEGATDALYAYAFESKSAADLAPTVENNRLYGILPADQYAADEDGFKISVTAKTEDGFAISADKAVTLQKEHSGGTATCTEKAICEVCGEPYGETDSTNCDLEKVPAQDATVTETGNKEYWHCKDCENVYFNPEGEDSIEIEDTVIAKLPPEIIDGEGQSVTESEEEELAFRSNAALSDFIQVEVDGNVLDEKNYTVREGSTIVTLEPEYVATLSAGEHTMGIVSESGTAVTSFTVTEKGAEKETEKETEKENTSPGTEEPAETESKPAETENKPAETENKPAQTESKPAETENKPAETESKPAQSENKPGNAETGTPATGDETPLGMTIAVMMLSAAMLTVLLVRNKKRRTN